MRAGRRAVWLLLSVVPLSLMSLVEAGCENNLPVTSFVDKLRVLAVKAEPPEVAPGAESALSVLAVEPERPAVPISPLTAVWLACRVPPGVTTPLPCGLNAGELDTGSLPPACDAEVDGTLCLLGQTLDARVRPSAALLDAAGTGTLFLTVAVADTERGATACLVDTAQNGALPTEPDRCVIAEKRLVVSDPARPGTADDPVDPPNQNPALARFDLVDEDGTSRDLLDGTAVVPLTADDAETDRSLVVHRADAAAERRANGAYEALALSWFTNAGRIDGGRSTFDPPDCESQAACASVPPVSSAQTTLVVPTAKKAGQLSADGKMKVWAVLRDDRGGVGWLEGVLTVR